MYIRGFLHLFRAFEFQSAAHKKPFRRGREGFLVFRDPSWSRGQNCWDELGIPLFRGGALSSSNQGHRARRLSHVPGRGRNRPSYFFLVVFFVVFLAAFFTTFFAMVVNHLLSQVCKSKRRAKKCQRISFSCVRIFCIAQGVVDVGKAIRTSNIEH